MIKRRIIFLTGLILSIGTVLSGCISTSNTKVNSQEAVKNKVQIGMSFDSFVIERWLRDRDVFVSTAKDLGAEVNVQNANGNSEEQINHIKYFIKKKVDVLVIIAGNYDALKDVVLEARNGGIKIICYDRPLMGVETDLYISFDNVEVGRLMAQALAASVPEGGSLFMIKGSPTDYNVIQVDEGFQEVINAMNLNVVYSEYCDNWMAEKAYDAVSVGLEKYRNVGGVMCGNDDLANYAFRALSENRLAGKVAMVGQDGDLAACQRIVEGTQTMTVYKPMEELAKAAAEFAVQLGEGKDLMMTNFIDVGDGMSTPYVALTPIAVTKDNIDKVIIESGFHSREEVYLNVQQSQ